LPEIDQHAGGRIHLVVAGVVDGDGTDAGAGDEDRLAGERLDDRGGRAVKSRFHAHGAQPCAEERTFRDLVQELRNKG